jgi:hypothetical protein
MFKFYISFLLVFFLSSSVLLAQVNDKMGGFFDPSFYYNSNAKTDASLNILLTNKQRITYFSLLNLYATEHSTDMSNYFTKQYLFYSPFKNIPIEINQVWISSSGNNNDYLRYGFRWNIHKMPRIKSFFEQHHLILFANVQCIQLNNAGKNPFFPEFELIYRWFPLNKYSKNRIYVAGFFDQCVDRVEQNTNATLVSEHQLGVRLWDNFYCVGEVRYNEYLAKSLSLGVGIEYLVRF